MYLHLLCIYGKVPVKSDFFFFPLDSSADHFTHSCSLDFDYVQVQSQFC